LDVINNLLVRDLAFLTRKKIYHQLFFLTLLEDTMKTIGLLFVLAALLMLGCQQDAVAPPQQSQNQQVASLSKLGTGFDEFGYNYQARLFQGLADGVDRVMDGMVNGDATYANDHLVMKWSKAWDDARFNGAPWTPDAWENNEWNGAFPGGSGEVWHYKIIWVGPSGEESPYWREGGYLVWGDFEVIMDQGTDADHVHSFLAHAYPTGYGAPVPTVDGD
jgi:hypothetical protein